MGNLLANNSALIHAMGWTILHSLWQGLMLFCILKIALRFITEEKARLRYNISLGVLSAHAIWVVVTFINQLESAKLYIAARTTTLDISSNTAANIGNTQTGSKDLLATTQLWLDSNTNLIVTIYIIGITALTIRLIYNLFAIKRIKNNGEYCKNVRWNNILHTQANRLGISRNVTLLLSKNITTPMVMGVFKPVVLFPFATMNNLSTEQFEAILLHELAHIKRQDYLVNILQTVLETILFYNPFVWLISKTIRIEREHSCDDIVTNNADKLPYANALAAIAMQAQNTPKPALAAAGNKYYLLNRIKRIIEMKKSPITKLQITTVVVLVLSLVLSITLISPTLSAQTKEDKKEEKKKDKKKKQEAKTITIASEKITLTDDDGNTRTYSKLEDIPQKDRAQLKSTFGKNTTVYYGPKKKVIVKSNGTYKVNITEPQNEPNNEEEENIEIELEKLGEDFGKNMAKTVLVALNELDWDELGDGLKEAMEGIGEAMEGTGEAMAEVNAALKEIDWNEIHEEIHDAIEEMGPEEREEIKREIAKIKTELHKMSPEEKEKMKTEIAKAKTALKYALAETREEVHHARKEALIHKEVAHKNHQKAMESHHHAMAKHKEALESHRHAMAKHKESMKKHKASVAENSRYHKMLKMMDQDGLINKDKKFVIEKKGKRDLYIDGIKQSNEVYNKYKEHLSADELLIKGSKNSLSISVENN